MTLDKQIILMEELLSDDDHWSSKKAKSEYKQLLKWLKDYKRLLEMPKAVEPFTQLEKEEIADAITYLLDAELLEENGYTEEVINALKSALKKVGGEGNETNN